MAPAVAFHPAATIPADRHMTAVRARPGGLIVDQAAIAAVGIVGVLIAEVGTAAAPIAAVGIRVAAIAGVGERIL